ncbi:uncharacterized protein CTHT_0044140 [Thermochaetoides thermophila DSM 1495]|uniref:Uncharacterized protein n=1 Tax=Chaetomium thermophilum (strain DSM 1495 / CBS 144.50 / IMI 039719) TaxID=759272 RepID=G0S910_CHATD|nr:hypothetical protein CTHT_0044140 [Thermochaetoides thermophila DSM 1495]EGS19921.1 hypothetical protein CTHT_0044140 [Thermochaetoides thermophila DSM 1495]
MSASKDTAKAKQATRQRRTIMRFALDSISIDDRPNNYKDAQLVLKPQLELATRKDNPKSRTRKPIWRHFLMVHIKDKADELMLTLFSES